MARRLISALVLTLGVTLASFGGGAPNPSRAHADNAANPIDPTLQQTANAIVPFLERVAAHHPRIHPNGGWNDPYLARLKKVLKNYRAQHPSPGIQLAVSLFSESGHKDLTSRKNEKWDFLSSPWFFDGPTFETETNYYGGVSTRSYRVYATQFAIPKAYSQQGFKPSLAVFAALSTSSGVAPTAGPACNGASPRAVVRGYYTAINRHETANAQACLTPYFKVQSERTVDPDWINIVSVRNLRLRAHISRPVPHGMLPGNVPGKDAKPYAAAAITAQYTVRYYHVIDALNGDTIRFIYAVEQHRQSPWRIAAIGSGP